MTMEATHPTAGWENVGDKFYRKIQLYTAIFDQDLDLDNYIVAGAPYGGAVGKPHFCRFKHTPLYRWFLYRFNFRNPLAYLSFLFCITDTGLFRVFPFGAPVYVVSCRWSALLIPSTHLKRQIKLAN